MKDKVKIILVAGAICDIFFTTSVDADENLIKEGHDKEEIFMYGNLMIDSLVKNLKKARSVNMEFRTLNGKKIKFGKDFKKKNYGVMTFHRPSNVDDSDKLLKLVNIWGRISEKIPLVFPIHPRTNKNLKEFGLFDRIQSFAELFLIEPAAYLQFINLVKNSRFVLTDSGGIQEETTYLNIPCLTIRPTTERPVTIWEGTNKLIKKDEIIDEIEQILAGNGKKGKILKYWDGKSAERIVKILNIKFLRKKRANSFKC